jgi:hypothetical protein
MQRVDVMIEVVGESLKVSAVDFGRATVLGHVPLAPSDSDRRRFFARLHARAAAPEPLPTSVSGSRRHQPERSDARAIRRADCERWSSLR